MLDQPDLLCLSHLRWSPAYPRAQQLLRRCARDRRVYFVEPPVLDTDSEVTLERVADDGGVVVCVPHLPAGIEPAQAEAHLAYLLDQLVAREDLQRPVLWLDSPALLAACHHLSARAVVYDCVDPAPLGGDAPARVVDRERLLLAHADLVLTPSHALHERLRGEHPAAHAVPSAIDPAPLARARALVPEPDDQAAIPHPRIGYAGPIDARLDLALVELVAMMRPELHFVFLGDTAELEAASLPQAPNLHWLGARRPDQLPAYLAGWEVAMLPLVRPGRPELASPTAAPSFLAAGCAVVATSARDVVRPWGEQGLAWIGDSPAAFACAIDNALAEERDRRLARVDRFLAEAGWDHVWDDVWSLIEAAARTRARRARPAAAPTAGAGSVASVAFARLDQED